jgi:hypothetical protein
MHSGRERIGCDFKSLLIRQYIKACHSGEGRNPENDWMPDQVRHDVVGILICFFNRIIKKPDFKFEKIALHFYLKMI